ncbi:MAG: hypothetical protein RR192_01315, partial [Peptostreptococcaceae bacterium]
MEKRKTKGSSMLLVIVIFGILSTLGVAMVGAAYGNYKLRIEENNRVKNLYSAESGIDEAYAKMNQVISEALDAGITVGNSMTSIRIQNNTFKKTFNDYILDNLKAQISGEYTVNGRNATVLCEVAEDENSGVVIATFKDGVEVEETIRNKKVKLISSYKDDNNKERIVSVSYDLSIPENYRTMGKADGEPSKVINYSLATDGNLAIINSIGNKSYMKIQGDIWVQGTKSDKIADNPTIEKYSGGIKVGNTNVGFLGEVNTTSSITVDGGEVNFNSNNSGVVNNVLAENIFLGNLKSLDESSEIKVQGDKANVYLANDLVIGSSDAKVDIKNFYGFNDLNVNSNINNEKEARESSSIIINSMTWPKNKANINVGYINIKESAYIMGAAYIKIKADPYQTGESVSLKGNYKAYSSPAEGDYNSGQYEYLDPLVLLTKNAKGEALNLEDKAEHFVNYSKGEGVDLRTSGISLPPETYSTGAYISNNKVESPKGVLSTEVQGKLKEFKRIFVESVYYMDKNKLYTEEESIDQIIGEDFKLGQAKSTVSSEVNWDGVAVLISEEGNILDLGDIKVILNDVEDSIVTVDDNKIIIKNKNGIALPKGEILYDSKYRYVIVTSGVVNFNTSKGYNGGVFALKD